MMSGPENSKNVEDVDAVQNIILPVLDKTPSHCIKDTQLKGRKCLLMVTVLVTTVLISGGVLAIVFAYNRGRIPDKTNALQNINHDDWSGDHKDMMSLPTRSSHLNHTIEPSSLINMFPSSNHELLPQTQHSYPKRNSTTAVVLTFSSGTHRGFNSSHNSSPLSPPRSNATSLSLFLLTSSQSSLPSSTPINLSLSSSPYLALSPSASLSPSSSLSPSMSPSLPINLSLASSLSTVFSSIQSSYLNFTHTTNSSSTGNSSHCLPGWRSCNDGECIHPQWVCDRELDCSEGEDEFNCSNCGLLQFTCFNYECVQLDQRCDGTSHCVDGSDERQCARLINKTLEINYKGVFLPVCYDSWREDMGEKTCKELGLGAYISISPKDVSTGRSWSLTKDGRWTVSKTCSHGIQPECSLPSCGSNQGITTAPNTYVIGGRTAAPGDWPWHVQITREGRHRCGGSLVSSQWVLTAGHCVSGLLVTPQIFSVYLGSVTNKQSEITRDVTQIVHHPKLSELYSSQVRWYNDWDFALLKLSTPVQFSDTVRPVCLPDGNQPPPVSSLCYVTGFGYSKMDSSAFSTLLHQAKVRVIPKNQCSRMYPNILTTSMICAGYSTGQIDACKGDSGGPLVCLDSHNRWTVHGVVSWGKGCAEAAYPGVYGHVGQILGWIHKYAG